MTTIIYTGSIASEKQISFVTDLIAKREVEAELASEIAERIAVGDYTKKQASENIDAFMKLPKRQVASAARTGMQVLLASVPKSKYAIPVAELEFTDADDLFTGDLVFLEIKEYMQTLYVRQLHGAPGGFSRSKLSTKSVVAIVETLARDPHKYVKIFGEHYSCCGSCGAELTDPRSRELQLGPECRKKFGF